MEPYTPYQNAHNQLMLVIGSQQGETHWPCMVKLMSNIKQHQLFLIYQYLAGVKFWPIISSYVTSQQ